MVSFFCHNPEVILNFHSPRRSLVHIYTILLLAGSRVFLQSPNELALQCCRTFSYTPTQLMKGNHSQYAFLYFLVQRRGPSLFQAPLSTFIPMPSFLSFCLRSWPYRLSILPFYPFEYYYPYYYYCYYHHHHY